MDWTEQIRAAASGAAAEETVPVEGTVEVVVGGRTITVPAPTTAGDLINAVGDTPASVYYIVVDAETGRKIPVSEEIEPGTRVYLVPVRTDG